MWKPTKSRAEQHFAASQKKDDKVIKQKEKTEREREERMTRLRDLRLAKEAAEQRTSDAPETPEPALTPEEYSARLPKVHPHRS